MTFTNVSVTFTNFSVIFTLPLVKSYYSLGDFEVVIGMICLIGVENRPDYHLLHVFDCYLCRVLLSASECSNLGCQTLIARGATLKIARL